MGKLKNGVYSLEKASTIRSDNKGEIDTFTRGGRIDNYLQRPSESWNVAW